MATLILAKHAMPHIRPDTRPDRWHLSPDGVAGARRLGERLRAYAPDRIVSSTEPKALETAAIVAEVLGLPLETAEGLHEHERPESGVLGTEEFARRIADVFARPDEIAYGAESANAALRRFSTALDAILAAHERDVVVVSHGTVISLFAAARAGQDALALWSLLGLPSFIVLARPTFALTEVIAAL